MQANNAGLAIKVRYFLEMIKFSHTIFAFPFALTGVVLASMANGAPPSIGQIFWICMAMVGARSAAMGMNRVIDAAIDRENPRTAGRHIPAGIIQRREALFFILVSLVLLLVAAWMLNPLCLALAPVAVFFLFLYSWCKRFTSLAHIVLGLCLAAAPLGAWIALRGDLGWPVISLAVAVLCWVAGFDIFYSLQDEDFDRKAGLHSIPVRLGTARAILVGKILHGIMIIALLSLLFLPQLGWIYGAGMGVVMALIAYEHQLVRVDDLSRLDAAFFNMNGYISVLVFLMTLLDALL